MIGQPLCAGMRGGWLFPRRLGLRFGLLEFPGRLR